VLPYDDVADRIRAMTDANETVFVWGQYPELYWASDRAPATRLIHTGFVTGSSGGRPEESGRPIDGVPGAWDMLRRDLALHPPALVVDTTKAGIRGSEYHPLSGTSLWTRMSPHYRLVDIVDGVDLYRAVGDSP
jgi:hypothetical protein